jgi:predicted RNase H-like HicB family nuclease
MPGLKVEREHYVLDGYEVLSYFSTDDEVYVAEIDQLPGCAAEGETREESLTALKAFKPEWISEMLAIGKRIPVPKFIPDRVLA